MKQKNRNLRGMPLLRAAALLAGALFPAQAVQAGMWPDDSQLYIISPRDGDVLTSPVRVVFGLRGVGVAPAGTMTGSPAGHHHILLDTEAPKGEALTEPLPADRNFLHFGGGQTETTLDLAPGRHTLQLILGDRNHIPGDPPLVSGKIAITVR